MSATDDAVSLSNLELELSGPFSENTEEDQTERELVESLNNLWAGVDEGNSAPNEAAVANHLTEEPLDTEMTTLSLQESYHITSHASSTNSSLLPTIENEDIMEDLHYYPFHDISCHDGTRTMPMSSLDLRRFMDLSILSSTDMVQRNSSLPSLLYPTVMSVNNNTSLPWRSSSPASYPSSVSSSDSSSSFSYSSSRDFDNISENTDCKCTLPLSTNRFSSSYLDMDVDDPTDLYKFETWANNLPIPVTLGNQPPDFLNNRALKKRRYRSQRGSLSSSSWSPPQIALPKLKASSRPYLIPNRAQRHRRRLKLRRIFQECISMCRSFVFLWGR